MAVYVIVGTLAAFGVLCAGWTLFGTLLSTGKGGCVICFCSPDGREEGFLRRTLLLRHMGLLKAPIYLLGENLPQHTADILKNEDFVFVVSPEKLTQILELERENLG